VLALPVVVERIVGCSCRTGADDHRPSLRRASRFTAIATRLSVASHGAEVIDGNIHVYAPLCGRALAGAKATPGAHLRL
jgi:hypothetical protein